MKQILLNAKECSGRGVRLRLLGPDASINAMESAAKEVGPDGTMTELRMHAQLNGVSAMVVGITEKDGFTTKADLTNAVWKKVTLEDLDGKLDKYFNSKDVDALIKIHHRHHTVSEEELNNILGEALDVSED